MDKPRLVLVIYTLPRHPAQESGKLASITYTEAEGVRPVIEGLELLIDVLVEPYDPCPALCRIEHICITEPADKDYAPEAAEVHLLLKKIGHGHVPGLKPGLAKRLRSSPGLRCCPHRG